MKKYYRLNEEYHKDQYLVPYLMSSHPGSDLNAAIELAEYLRDIHHQPQQVQDFIQLQALYQQPCIIQESILVIIHRFMFQRVHMKSDAASTDAI